jgi:hypothetical protein
MMWLLLTAFVSAQECAAEPPSIPSNTSVVWVSRNGKRAGNNQYLWVTPTSEVTRWIGSQNRATVGGLLRHLGLRRRMSEPRRRYKVVVFDADHASLCRPIQGEAPGAIVGGLPVCEPAQARDNGPNNGCGWADARDGDGASLVRATWGDLSANGFCVLPATRFLDEAQ